MDQGKDLRALNANPTCESSETVNWLKRVCPTGICSFTAFESRCFNCTAEGLYPREAHCSYLLGSYPRVWNVINPYALNNKSHVTSWYSYYGTYWPCDPTYELRLRFQDTSHVIPSPVFYGNQWNLWQPTFPSIDITYSEFKPNSGSNACPTAVTTLWLENPLPSFIPPPSTTTQPSLPIIPSPPTCCNVSVNHESYFCPSCIFRSIKPCQCADGGACKVCIP